MSKKICAVLIIIFSLSLISCGDNENSSTENGNTNVEQNDSDTKSNSQNDTTKQKEKVETKDKNESGDNTKESGNEKEQNKSKPKVIKPDDKVTISKKKLYLLKLATIQAGLKDLDPLYAGSNVEMTAAANEEYKRWDAALNEIYGVLKTQLSKDEMSKLQKEEIQWIKLKQIKANAEAAKMNGGTGASFEYFVSLAKSTKDRCYELVNGYMK
jgi:uncharacterized protein YecT (DUF1311 family)